MKILTKKLIISWSVCSLLIIIYTEGSSGRCTTPGLFGDRLGAICKHVCHCAPGSGDCDKTTGACTSCASGYYGNTCQKQNVALGKDARQINTWFGNVATLAVNGNTSGILYDGRQCAHTWSDPYAWWYVDLGSEYNITSLRVYNRISAVHFIQDRLRGFTVRIGSFDPQRNSLPFCYQHSNTTLTEIPIPVTCASTMRGRYVRISLETRTDFLTLCEVQVFVCTDYSFGTDCNKRCHCKRESEVCDKVTGYCPSGCAAGCMGADCQTECPLHTYGDCVTSCSTHCKPLTVGTRRCNFISGDCTDTTGCQAGYMGSKCDHECLMNTYGECVTSCSTHCKPVTDGTRRCDFISGNCTIKSGCKPGYTGARCDQKCPMNKYGDCETKCGTHCKHVATIGVERQCNFISGHCTNTTGCQAGYTGARCDQECPVDYYGDCMAPCSKYCLAVNDGKRHCDFISGNCTDPSGCQGDYTGARCDKGPCSPSHFGKMCRSECHCASGSSECDQHTGACFYGLPCASGYHGNTCQKQNVALKKATNQSSTYTRFSADLAVNGDTSTNHATHPCAHTASHSTGWWYVDLGADYNINSLRIYNKEGLLDRLRGFVVRIGNSSPQLTTLPFCYQHPNTTPAEVIDVHCSRTMKGRYVRISLESREDYLTLCEVQVFVCTAYSFGEQCAKKCNCKYETEVCEKVTGACTSGCAVGYQGVDCQTECSMDTYGDCTALCSPHCIPADSGTRQCNFISGNCTDTTGCQTGYIGARCDNECTGYSFGLSCAMGCNCRDVTEVCSKHNGACLSGCPNGYNGVGCQTVAAQGGLNIAAIVIGSLLGLALIAALFVIYKQRRKYAKATQTKASLAGQVGQPTYQDLAHNIDANDAEKSVASPADIVIEYEMEGDEYDEIPQITTNERQHQQIAK